MTINELPADVQEIMPLIKKNIPFLIKGGFVARAMVNVIKTSKQFKEIMNNPEYKAIALEEISGEFGPDAKDKIIKIFDI